MKQKLASVFLVAVLLASVLAGCGGSGASQPEITISSGQDVASSSVAVSSIAEVQAFTEDRWVATTIVDGFQCYDVELAGLTEVMPLYNNLDAFDLAAKMKELGRTNEEAYKALNWNGRFPSFEEEKVRMKETDISNIILQKTSDDKYLYVTTGDYHMPTYVANEYYASMILRSAAVICSEEDFSNMILEIKQYLDNKEELILNGAQKSDYVLLIGKKRYPLNNETAKYMISLLMSFPDKSYAIERILIGDYINVQDAFDNSDKCSVAIIPNDIGDLSKEEYGNCLYSYNVDNDPITMTFYTPNGKYEYPQNDVKTIILSFITLLEHQEQVSVASNIEEIINVYMDFSNKFKYTNYS